MLHAADIYNHYRNVVLLMDASRVEMILRNSIGEPRAQLEARLERDGIPFVDYAEVARRKWRYRFLVTNHIIDGGGLRPFLPETLGVHNIRFMYAMGKARHNFSAWNEVYDVVLCHGPYQAEKLAFCRHTITLQMGYPRYDGYEAAFARRSQLRAELGVRGQRPVVLWMPTWQELSSIEPFMKAVQGITDRFDVVVKPHPLTTTKEPDRLQLLRDSGLVLVTDELLDITDLYAAADCVVADYGGSIFSALYVDKPIVLLDSELAEAHRHTGTDSPDVVVRTRLPHLGVTKADQLADVVETAMRDERSAAIREDLRERYFAPYRGTSAQVAAAYLANMDQILAGRSPRRLRRAARTRIRELARGERTIGSLGRAAAARVARRLGLMNDGRD